MMVVVVVVIKPRVGVIVEAVSSSSTSISGHHTSARDFYP